MEIIRVLYFLAVAHCADLLAGTSVRRKCTLLSYCLFEDILTDASTSFPSYFLVLLVDFQLRQCYDVAVLMV